MFAALTFYMLSSYIDYEPYNRAVATLNAAMTGDTDEVIKADHSASSRVNIIIDTFTKTDLSDFQTWVGHGMDAQSEYSINMAIYEYGMISYLVKIFFFPVMLLYRFLFTRDSVIHNFIRYEYWQYSLWMGCVNGIHNN